MNILFHLPKYLPDHASGAECTAHEYAKILKAKGHKVAVICDGPLVHYEYQGIEIHQMPKTYQGVAVNILYYESDLVISHLGSIGFAENHTRRFKKPLVYLVHNTINGRNMSANKHIGVVYNANWVRDHWQQKENWPNESIVCYPPIDFARFEALRGKGERKYVTLINLNENKGGHILKEIATQLPNVDFLGITGSYGKQVLDQPDNVFVAPNTHEIEDVYLQTKILLVPSEYEAFGRVAVEGMAAGCEVLLYDKAEGLGEIAFGFTKLYGNVPSLDPKFWIMHLKMIVKEQLQPRSVSKIRTTMEEQVTNFCTFIETIGNEAKQERSKWIRWD